MDFNFTSNVEGVTVQPGNQWTWDNEQQTVKMRVERSIQEQNRSQPAIEYIVLFTLYALHGQNPSHP